MSYSVGHRHNLDLTLLWLWHRPAATALIRPLAWEPPYAVGVALKKTKRKKKKNQQKEYSIRNIWGGVPVVAQWLTNPTRNHEVAGSVPALAQWVNHPALP